MHTDDYTVRSPGARGGRTRAVMEAIRRRIATRALAAGERLPSIRRLAEASGVSPSTVVEAYDRLVAEGLAEARPGSGFYVAGRAAAPVPLAPRRERAIDPLWVTRQSLESPTMDGQPGCGWLPADWMAPQALRRGLRKAARGEAARLTAYGPARGSPALRGLLARRFAAEGLDINPGRILLAASTTRALDLVCRFLLRPGDHVLVDDPCYFNFLALLMAHRVEVVGLPWGPDGPDPAAFEARVAALRPRLYVTNAALHNPTGATLPAPAAHRILAAAAAAGVAIVEDEIFADFEPEPSTRLATLDGLSRTVVRIGGFSKSLSAALRCGYVAARADWIEGLVDLQAATEFAGVDPIAADLVHGALADGGYRKHMAALRARLVERRREAGRRLDALGVAAWNVPRGGFHLWRRLPDGLDAGAAARLALREELLLAPGDVFSVGRRASDMMRFNVAQMDGRAFDRLARALEAARRASPG